jgi:hypothetical protein
MKDGNIIEFMQSAWGKGRSRSSAYKTDITTIDYFVSLNTIEHTLLIIINPLKRYFNMPCIFFQKVVKIKKRVQ